MRLFTVFRSQIKQLGSLNRPAKLFLLTILLDGFLFSGWNLFLNFYVLKSGFNREFLGMVNAMPSVAALIFAVPMGLLSDRIGRKRAMLLGFTLANTAMIVQIIVTHPIVMLTMAFTWGIAAQLYILSQAPFMMKVSDDKSRDFLFSLSFGIFPLASTLGNALAGQLPSLYHHLFSLKSESAAVYQAVLLTSLISSFAALIPLAFIRESDTTESRTTSDPDTPKPSLWSSLTRSLTLKLALPNLFVGLGAGLLIPYMNLFFSERHGMGDQSLGWLFSLQYFLIGMASIFAPRLVVNLGGKVRTVVLGQSASLIFLLLLGFSPITWWAVIGFLARGVLMNMVAPLFDAYAMERTPESERGAVNSVRGLALNLGWAIGPYISGAVQETHGFTPLIIATAILYGLAISTTWGFFRKTGIHPSLPV